MDYFLKGLLSILLNGGKLGSDRPFNVVMSINDIGRWQVPAKRKGEREGIMSRHNSMTKRSQSCFVVVCFPPLIVHFCTFAMMFCPTDLLITIKEYVYGRVWFLKQAMDVHSTLDELAGIKYRFLECDVDSNLFVRV